MILQCRHDAFKPCSRVFCMNLATVLIRQGFVPRIHPQQSCRVPHVHGCKVKAHHSMQRNASLFLPCTSLRPAPAFWHVQDGFSTIKEAVGCEKIQFSGVDIVIVLLVLITSLMVSYWGTHTSLIYMREKLQNYHLVEFGDNTDQIIRVYQNHTWISIWRRSTFQSMNRRLHRIF